MQHIALTYSSSYEGQLLDIIYHSYLLPDFHDTGDIFKVKGFKFKVTDNIFQKYTFLAEVYRLTVRCQTPSSFMSECF